MTRRLEAISEAQVDAVVSAFALLPLDEPRTKFMKSMESVDVSACPGSGKTTLVVAKLAILIEAWPFRGSGICALSHTNVARNEIEERLGGTDYGQSLKRHPHFVDTIHGFINKFIAIPWLRKHEHLLTMIDDDATHSFRWGSVPIDQRYGLTSYLGRHFSTFEGLKLKNTDFANPQFDFPGKAGPNSASYRAVSEAFRAAANAGFFCHDDMLIFAEKMLDEEPGLIPALRARFPFVLLDEMQDATPAQRRILSKIFPLNDPSICVQRVGDENQSIYNLNDSISPYSFPRQDVEGIDIANSFRLVASIANLASGFAMSAVNPSGLVGLRTPDSSTIENCIFLFDPEDIELVLPTYGAYLRESITGELLSSGTFSAIGEVHKPDEQPMPHTHLQFPKNIGHYWAGYGKTKAVHSQAKDLIGAYYRAKGFLRRSGSVAPALDEVAKAFIRILNKRPNADRISIRSRPHRQLCDIIVLSGQQAGDYQEELCKILFKSTNVSQAEWSRFVTMAITLLLPTVEFDVSTPYLAWRAETSGDAVWPIVSSPSENTFVYSSSPNDIKIKVGTIHSVKGETHTATLVLETYKYAHFLKKLLPWLKGRNVNALARTQDADLKRLALAYVAFTRPTHLLCVAMLSSSLGEGAARERSLAELASSGWTVKYISRTTP